MKSGLAMESVAVKPEAQALVGFDAEIIARETVLLPPFHGDAFRSFGAHDMEIGLAPAEAAGRAFRGHEQGRADFFGPLQQSEWAQRWIIVFAPAHPSAREIALLGRNSCALRFGNMRVLGHK